MGLGFLLFWSCDPALDFLLHSWDFLSNGLEWFSRSTLQGQPVPLAYAHLGLRRVVTGADGAIQVQAECPHVCGRCCTVDDRSGSEKEGKEGQGWVPFNCHIPWRTSEYSDETFLSKWLGRLVCEGRRPGHVYSMVVTLT